MKKPNGLGRITEHFSKAIDQGQVNVYRVIKTIKSVQETLMGLANPIDRARFINRITDGALAQWKRKDPETMKMIPCKANCSACCHMTVDITDDEAELLADLIINNKVQVDLDRLKAQAKVPYSKEPKDDWFKTPWAARACPFLGHDGNCRVYEDRPHTCRKWFIAEPTNEMCKEEDGAGMLAFSPQAEAIAAAANSFDVEGGRLATKVHAVLVRRGFLPKDEK